MQAGLAFQRAGAGFAAAGLVALFAVGNVSTGVLITGPLTDAYPAFSPYGGSAFKLAMALTFVVPMSGILALFAGMRPQFLLQALPASRIRGGFFYYIALMVALPLSFLVLGTEVETLSKLAFPDEAAYRQFMAIVRPTGHKLDQLGALLSIGLIGPVCEEMLFRGFVIRTLMGWPAMAAVLLQGLLFAALHGNLWQFSYALPMGVVLGAVRIWSGGLASPVLVHVSNNVSSVIALYWFPDIPFFNQDDFGRLEHLPWPMLAAASALLTVTMVYIFQNRQLTSR